MSMEKIIFLSYWTAYLFVISTKNEQKKKYVFEKKGVSLTCFLGKTLLETILNKS